ncbi:hypothetical protein CALVIDRAFT_568799 [Calocera viscosa TUFC12733]|uniref:FAS1 domain-containing protein n=1 Tax=Calocera viscosa (strain TUFC12733) TaxID=1330018 RepID=A0A167GN80_CALVF|nr:hypothetical protein CALVIDRAFT_568799 [Calocera viscosa TUFC12733]
MRPRSDCLLFLLALIPSISAQSLNTVLQQQNLTYFNALVTANPSLFTSKNTTVLAPSDAAFAAAAQQQTGANAPIYDIPSLLSYHQLIGTITLKNLSNAQQDGGEVVSTMLKNATVVNMGGVSNVVGVPSAMQLGTQGTASNTGGSNGQQIAVQGGLGRGANVTAGDFVFDGGLVQIIDQVLDIPDTCSKTLTLNNVTAFVQYLSMSFNLVPSSGISNPDPVGFYDNLTEVTCFAPDNTAFAAQAPIYDNLNTQQLSAAMGLHIFRGVFYGSETPSGSILAPMWGNGTKGFVFERNSSGMFIGNSQLIKSDWMLKNGVVHILDKPLNWTEAVPINSSDPAFSGYGGPINGSSSTTAGASPSQTAGNSGAMGRQTYLAGGISALAFVVGSALSVL